MDARRAMLLYPGMDEVNMPNEPEKNIPVDTSDSAEYSQIPDTIPETGPQPEKDTLGEFLFQIFCAVIFLSMIGLVFYNAMLRYVFSSSYPPSEEWARFLFIYITFFGSVEAFYRKKQIAVDMFVVLLKGTSRKTVDIVASLLGMAAMAFLLWGGLVYLADTYNQRSVATYVYMGFIYGTLPVMAAAVLVIQIRDFIALLKRPASSFGKK